MADDDKQHANSKTLLTMKAILLLALSAAAAAAFPVTLDWDLSPPEQEVVAYRVHHGASLLGATPAPPFTMDLPESLRGAGVYVTAVDRLGRVSQPSYVVFLPNADGSLQWRRLEFSDDLKGWHTVTSIQRREPQRIRWVANRPYPAIEQSNDNGVTWSLVVSTIPQGKQFARLAFP